MNDDLNKQIMELLRGLDPKRKTALDRVLAPKLNAKWRPNAGPQTAAYESEADLLLFGGAAGGGKTDLLLGLALTKHQRSVIFRRAYVDLRGVEERLLAILGSREGYNGQDHVFNLNDRLLEMGALERPGSEFGWQGRPHDFIGFDEGAQLQEAKVRFVLGWLRTATPGQRTRAVIASNPPIGGEGDWTISWFAPWLDPAFPNPAKDGELRWCVMSPRGQSIWVDEKGWFVVLEDGWRPATDDEIALASEGKESPALESTSRTFIAARLDDNPHLKGTGYRAQIMGMDEPLRSKLLHGDFLAGREDDERQVIPSKWIQAAMDRWKPDRPSLKMLSLGCDPAQGGADQTVVSTLYGTWFDRLVVREGKDTPNGPSVAALIVEHRRDNAQIAIDLTGGFGGSARDHLEGSGIPVLPVVFSASADERTRDGTLEYANVRSQLYWQMREALDPVQGDNIALPPDRRLAAELGAATWSIRGTRIQIEPKDEIRKRIGMSPDRADAVCLAWHKRSRALFMQQHGAKLNREWAYAVPEVDPFAYGEE